MAIKQRAVRAEDKVERHQAILDAAARLLQRAPEREASVAEVADEAGVAKGTVYLYFPGKDELLIALHERNVGALFDALIARLDSAAPLAIVQVLDVLRHHMIDTPLFQPLASRCFGVMRQSADGDAGRAFKHRMAGRLERAGTGLERQFVALRRGDGVDLLRHSYALVLGLWQMSASSDGASGTRATTGVPVLAHDAVADDLDRALTALWRGTLAPDLPHTR
jgi:AcrR family transcriptional regulator